MSVWKPNTKIPRLGSKIEYALKANKIEVAVYGDLSKMYVSEKGIGLSDFEDWNNVLMWRYIDEFYNYGENLKWK